ncbi:MULTISPECIES: phage protein Gp37 [Thalassospira]|uniref:phage protein Gp37 n=1 Tax=Thalassospira TaxID=168934 RepID=UPI000C38B91D|nr:MULTISPECIES: phage protein Gp37 [Thalassospira]MAB32232.1 hypothetical protein [Thalassospira sp.]HBS22704.1 hypothetical protein [Thalassospira sp.]|tara:strand:- start:1095 stop:1673 length:579 start_codon:yes stop_codon:yes gene_type:complete
MIGDLEKFLKETLIAQRDQRDLKVTIDTYGGQLDEDLLREIAQKAPAIYVTFSGMTKAARQTARGRVFDGTFVLIAASKAVNDEHARGGGRGGRITGAFDLLDFALFATSGLDHETLDRSFEAERITNLFNAKVGREYLAVYALALSCRFTITPDWGIADLDDLETIHHTSALGGEGTPIMETDLPQTEEEA